MVLETGKTTDMLANAVRRRQGKEESGVEAE